MYKCYKINKLPHNQYSLFQFLCTYPSIGEVYPTLVYAAHVIGKLIAAC